MPRKTVLVVDASADPQLPAPPALGEDEVQVIFAASAKEAEAVAASQALDAVVIDSVLPSAGAYPLARKLKAASPATPLIFLVDVQGEKAAVGAGAIAFLAKPHDSGDVARTLQWVLVARPERDELERALAHVRAGELDRAVDALNAVIDAAPAGPVGRWAQYHVGRVYQEQGNAQAALENLAALLEEDPTFWRAHAQLGLIFERQGESRVAIHHFGRSLELYPHQALVRRRVQMLEAASAKAETGPPDVEGESGAEPASRAPVSDTDKVGLADLGRAAASGASDARPEILVADDSELAVDMLREVLEGAGYRVRTAVDGREALAMAKAARPDLVILDGLMPGLTGFDVCKELKENVYPDDPPKVIILSAIYTKQRQRTEAQELYRVDEVLAKPCEDERLVATVRRFVSDSRHAPPPHGAAADTARVFDA